jgi:sulfofructose kinase
MVMDIVGLGMAALDILICSQDLPTWEGGTPLSGIALEGGGPVATALAAASRLGAGAGFVGTYGSDRLGAIKLQTLQEFGVDTGHAICRPGPDNQVILVNVQTGTGERVFSWRPVQDCPPLSPDELDRGYITQAEFLHLDGYHLQAGMKAAGWMHAAGKRVMLDGSATRGPISEEIRALAGCVDILICGAGFLQALTGNMSLADAGPAALEMGIQAAIQTEGRDGSYTFTRQGSFHTPAFAVEVIDTTGAGDVFHGAYLVALLHGWDWRRSAVFSTAVSAIKCTQLSGRRGIPTYGQTLDFLADRGYARDDFCRSLAKIQRL